jgi:hypothetical protein
VTHAILPRDVSISRKVDMVATFVHLLPWLAAAFAAIWALSSLGVAAVAIAALRGNRRVIVEEPQALSAMSGDFTASLR